MSVILCCSYFRCEIVTIILLAQYFIWKYIQYFRHLKYLCLLFTKIRVKGCLIVLCDYRLYRKKYNFEIWLVNLNRSLFNLLFTEQYAGDSVVERSSAKRTAWVRFLASAPCQLQYCVVRASWLNAMDWCCWPHGRWAGNPTPKNPVVTGIKNVNIVAVYPMSLQIWEVVNTKIHWANHRLNYFYSFSLTYKLESTILVGLYGIKNMRSLKISVIVLMRKFNRGRHVILY